MTTEAKVGAFTLAALAILAFMVTQLGGYGFGGEKNYPVQAVFAQVNGLKQGNLVRYAGVDVGRVGGVEPDGGGAKVTLLIRQGVNIPAGAMIGIGSDGLVGEKFISISPGDSSAEGFLKPGDMLIGYEQRGLDHLMATADEVLAEMQKLARSMNEVLGDERLKNALIDSAVNAKEFTENLTRMSAVLTRMAVNNEADMRIMVGNLTLMSQNMAGVAVRVDRMLADIDNDGQTASDLREAIANLNMTSRRVENMAVALEGVVTDPETAEDIKETLRNAKSVSQKADRMMRRVSEISAEASTEVLYSAGEDRYMTNADIRIHMSPNDFILLGVNDIGEGDKTNLQIGTGSDKFTGRAGIFDNKAGLGLDSQLSPAFKLSVDAYDPNDFRLKLRAQYEFAPDTFLVGQTDNVNKGDERESFVGLRRSF